MGQQDASRYQLSYPVSLLYSERTRLPGALPRVQLKGHTHDLSKTGMGLEIDQHHQLTPGQDITVIVHYGDILDSTEALSLFGRIIWVTPERMGLKLLQLDLRRNVAGEQNVRTPGDSRSFYYSLLEGFQSLTGFEPVGHLEFD